MVTLEPDRPEEPSSEPSPALQTRRTSESKAGLIVPEHAEIGQEFGPLGRPFSRHSPFYLGFWGALGIGLAYLVYRAVSDIGGVLLVIGVAFFLAVGLAPAVEWLQSRGFRRTMAVALIIVAFLVVLGGFIASAVPPISHEVSTLINKLPAYRRDVSQGRGWVGHLAKQLHLTSYLRGSNADRLKSTIETGALGAGKAVVSATTGVLSGVVLTIYFLIALPKVRVMALNLIPASRRERTAALTDEIFSRVGGFVLGNLLTSLVAGLGTYIWLTIFAVPYPFLLALFVALFDLIPVVGSTIAGIVVSLVALVRGLPIAVATAAFYAAYRFVEDYLLTPRVMRHTVRISPGLTIIATLIGGTLLGLIGALVAIPCAAAIYLLLEEVVFPRMDRL
jgi:predicted PurR-regulated permease PerM